MRLDRAMFAAAALVCGLALPARAQGFDSGSTCATNPPGQGGCLGNVTYSTNTVVTLPPDGILSYGTLTVGGSATVSFTKNALNTPVYILATGAITVTGTISANGSQGTSTTGGAGGPGGFDGGHPGMLGNVAAPAGAGFGPGAGKPGVSGFGTNHPGEAAYRTAPSASYPSTNAGSVYGTALLMPLVGGSGGGGTDSAAVGGGGGGGAVLLASNTSITLNGSISATGAYQYGTGGSFGGGSGGAIRLVAPVVAGSGALDVGGTLYYNSGGSGWTRIDAVDHSGSSITVVNTYGAFFRVFPSPLPRLDIVQVASQLISVGTSSQVDFMLPFGSPASQPVVVRATDMPGVTVGCSGPTPCLPIRVVLTPENGAPLTYDSEIYVGGANPADATVTVQFPANVKVRVSAWSR